MRGGNYWDSGDWKSAPSSEPAIQREVQWTEWETGGGGKVKASTTADSPAAGSFLDQVSGFP